MKKAYILFILILIMVLILRINNLISSQSIASGVFAALLLDWIRLNIENKKLRKK